MESKFYSNGKLLLSGEYAILDGALGLAIPTKYGQSLNVTTTNSGFLEWTSFDANKSIWFQGIFDLKNFSCRTSLDSNIENTLTRLLQQAHEQNPSFLVNSSGIQVETQLGFPRNWGLGSSSTLINNIAQWAQVDAYRLLWNAFGGSGYDIACAQSDQPILYQLKHGLPVVDKISFSPYFKENLYFVYLNKKQSSKQAIANYRKKQFDTDALVSEVSKITEEMIAAQNLSAFEVLLVEHERILSKVLEIPPIKSQLFSDYPGAIKSLGAWGGDFVLVTAEENPENYFGRKGFNTAIPFSNMVL